MSHVKRNGFTLVELLVVMSIIGILMGLLLPAVQAARERARLTQCQNYTRQLALAAGNYESLQKMYPPYAKFLYWEMNSSGQIIAPMNVSWAVLLTPHLDRMDLWNRWSDANQLNKSQLCVPLEFLHCPSSARSESYDGAVYCDYAINCGTPEAMQTSNATIGVSPATGVSFDHQQVRSGNPPGWTWTASQKGLIPAPPTGKPMRIGSDAISAKDGTTYTILFSENIQSTVYVQTNNAFTDNSTYWAPGISCQADVGMLWDGYRGMSDATTATYKINNGKLDAVNPFALDAMFLPPAARYPYARPSSRHSGVVVVAHCDGHAANLSETIQYQVFRQLMAPDDALCGATVGGWPVLNTSDF